MMNLCTRKRHLLSLVIALFAFLAASFPAHAYIIVFKDGFTIHGKIRKERTMIVDRVSGRAFSVPMAGAPYSIETNTTEILFSPTQVFDVMDETPSYLPKWMNMKLYGRRGGLQMPFYWAYSKIGPFNDRWERTIHLRTSTNQGDTVFPVVQRVTNLNPYYVRLRAMDKYWASFFDIKEFSPKTVKKLLEIEFGKTKKHKDLSKAGKSIKIAQFLAQCGWIDSAEKELRDFLKQEPAEKSQIEPELANLKKAKTMRFVEELELAYKLGRFKQVHRMLEQYEKEDLASVVEETTDLRVFGIKDQLQKNKERIILTQEALRLLPLKTSQKNQPFLTKAANDILKELNHETVARLDTFMTIAEVYKLDIDQERKPSFTPDQVMAFALTGWLLGKDAAEESVDLAKKLWQTRDFVLKYQNTSSQILRRNMRQAFEKNVDISMDLLARVIRMLPPPQPHEVINEKFQKIHANDFDEGPNVSYAIQLPPEYHHLRQYPVLIVLHGTGQNPVDMLRYWSEQAAKNGYILVAPAWGSLVQQQYEYSDDDQLMMMNLLRDLRKKFQVDSNRVFLFGLGEGGQMAYDVGLAHPDQFAGIMPMGAAPRFYAENYWPNAQYLPVYAVDGQLNGKSPQWNRDQFKKWIRYRYPVIYVEYKGRNKEWFAGEMPKMFRWMKHKRRFFPYPQVGARHTGGGRGEEMSTMRESDNRFYWISTNKILPQYLKHPRNVRKWSKHLAPAYMQARIYSGNQIYIYARGLAQVSIWLAPGMVDFSKPVRIKVNGTSYRPKKISPNLEILMEDFYDQGDRYRLFLDRIDLP